MHQGALPSFPWIWVMPRRCRRCRANAARSANDLPFDWVTKQQAAAASCATKTSRTSGPTSKAFGPMHGPSHASVFAATVAADCPDCGSRLAYCVKHDSSTPWARPRQPACAAPTARPSRSVNSTGRQSATRIVHTTPGVALVQASASSTPGGAHSRSSTDATPCTWLR